MGTHQHRAKGAFHRGAQCSGKILRFNNYREKLVFDTRSDTCIVYFDDDVKGKNRDKQVFAVFLDYKQERETVSIDGHRIIEVPVVELSLAEIKQRIKDYGVLGRDTSQLILARDACKKEYPTHRPRPRVA